MLPGMLVLTALLLPWLLAAPIGISPGLAQLLAQTPADSLLGPLRRYELQRRHGAAARVNASAARRYSPRIRWRCPSISAASAAAAPWRRWSS